MKAADALAGPLLCKALSRAQTRTEHRRLQDVPGPVLVIRPGGIGDAAMLLPMLAALEAAIPGRRIDVLCESRNAGIFRLARPGARVVAYDAEPVAALRMLFRGGYGAVIDTEQFHNASGVMAALTRAPLRIGFKINTNRRGLYTHLVSYDLDGPEDAQFGRLLSAACGIVAKLPPRAGILAAAALPSVPPGLLPARPFLLVHAGGSIPCKRCPAPALGAACRAVAEERGLALVVIGAVADRAAAAELAAHLGPDAVNLCGRLDLSETAAACRAAAALVGPDSGIAHLAVAVGTAAVVVFGPSDPAKWGPPAGCGMAVAQPLPCSPCSIFGYTKPCRSFVCINEIGPERIAEALCACLPGLKAEKAAKLETRNWKLG
jgi:ADP-heptose:LPS heptosyltransferase